MGTTADKLQKILDSKAAIKAAIEAKGVSDVGDVLAAYPNKIASIKSSGYTGHADVEGLKAIGWTDEDIEYYQMHGVNWNEEDDIYHKVPQNNIDLYGVLTIDNIQEYKDRIVYLPKLDTSGVTNMSNQFRDCFSLVAVPMMDTINVKNMNFMFCYCYSLTSVPQFDTSSVTNMNSMFFNCHSLTFIPSFNTSNVTSMSNMLNNCFSLISIPTLDTSNVTNMNGTFFYCYSLISIPLFDMSKVTLALPFDECYSIQNAKLKGLKLSLDIKETSFLTKESLLYIINNAAPTSPITITLSAYCYNKYNADPDVVTALSKQPNISLAST